LRGIITLTKQRQSAVLPAERTPRHADPEANP
jgi:hypothetical protein